MSAVYLQHMAWISALGRGAAAREALFAPAPGGVAPTDQYTPGRVLHLGRVADPLPTLEQHPLAYRSRTNALLAALRRCGRAVAAAFRPLRSRRGSRSCSGVSAAGLDEGVAAAQQLPASTALAAVAYDYAQQEMGNAAHCLAQQLGASGPAYAISTACSSGAKALASGGAAAERAGMVDAVVAGGVDALCGFTIAGFRALESVSAARCNPLSAQPPRHQHRRGRRAVPDGREPGPVRLAGWGESADAHHMSAPEPGGRGAPSRDARRRSRARASQPAQSTT